MRIVKSAGIDHVRRRIWGTFCPFAASSGASLNLIGEQLGHWSLATTQRYAHLARDPVRQATETTANIIAEAMQANGNKGPRKKGSFAHDYDNHIMEYAFNLTDTDLEPSPPLATLIWTKKIR